MTPHPICNAHCQLPPDSYFGDAQLPAKTHQALKGDEAKMELKDDGWENRGFELTHKALEERKDEQELWKVGQTDRERKQRKC